MAQLIDKDRIVAEIERLKECNCKICAGDFDFLKKTYPEHYYSTEIYNDILSFLGTLEVNEADLKKEIEEVKHNYKVDDNRHTSICDADIEWIAEHFFELGLKAQKG